MSNKKIDDKQGHWILAKMGKRVLRPGGKELTLKMISNMDIGTEDRVVEFAPGLGFTANLTLQKNPKSYTGVELNEEAAAMLRKKIKGDSRKIIIGNASKSTLEDNTYDKVYGEAMLTMHTDAQKSEIIREAYRILKPGGRYGIHEIELTPNDISAEEKNNVQKDLAKVIKVNARPLTESEWTALLESEGFEVVKVEKNPMHLLEKKRMIDDEGVFRAMKIAFNILTHKQARKRIRSMRSIFRKHKNSMNSISIVVEKK